MDCDMTLTLSEPICYILLPPGLLMFRLHVIQTQPKDGCTKSSIVSKEVRVITLKNVFSNVTLQITKTNLSVINLSYQTGTSFTKNILLVTIIWALQHDFNCPKIITVQYLLLLNSYVMRFSISILCCICCTFKRAPISNMLREPL